MERPKERSELIDIEGFTMKIVIVITLIIIRIVEKVKSQTTLVSVKTCKRIYRNKESSDYKELTKY